MGRMIITNNARWHDELSNNYIRNGFTCSYSKCESGFMHSVFHKLKVSNCNWYSCGEDFVSTNGTLIYREEVGEKALKVLYEDLLCKPVETIRKELVGSYSVVVKIGDIVRTFIDEAGTYELYYYIQDGKYLITNTYYHIAQMIKGRINELATLESLNEYSIYDNQSPFEEVY